LITSLADAKAMFELAVEAEDEEALTECAAMINALAKKTVAVEFARMMSDELDRSNAILDLNSGAGGTESQDWVEMLMRMYSMYAEKMGWKCALVDFLQGEEAGYKNVTLMIEGDYAYGRLKGETGVHRLVRISPFDSNARRHTSFASCAVAPEIDDSFDVEINESDLRIDVFRAGGKGGQHVNVTDSAVRITHIPTGIVTQCQNERSQHQNKATAMKLLKSKLYELEMSKRQAKAQEAYDNRKDIAWGSQIRSYVLHPYKMVKDLRTDYTPSNAFEVLDGELEELVESYLRWNMTGKSKTAAQKAANESGDED